MNRRDMGLDVDGAIEYVKRGKDDKAKQKKQGRLRSTRKSFVENVGNRDVAPRRQQSDNRGNAPAATAPPVLPIGQQLKLVYDFMCERRVPTTFKQIKESLKDKVDIAATPKLMDALCKHEKLEVDDIGRTVRYRPKYTVQNREQLHALIRKHPFGLISLDLRDAYSSAADDLKALVEDGCAFECGSRDYTQEGCTIVYPNDMKLDMDIPEQIRSNLMTMTIPFKEGEEADAALKAAGIPKAVRSTARLKTAVIEDNLKVGKKRKQRAIRNVTNAHMPELFQGALATQID